MKLKLERSERYMSNKALIVGNGFSINFDRSFSNIYGALDRGKNALLRSGQFNISLGAKPQTKKALKKNYQSVLQFVRKMDQKQLEKIFEDALKFAGFISNTPNILEQLLKSKHIYKLKTAPNMIEIAESIWKVGSEKGISYVNIENWPVLFWIYNLIDKTPEFKEFTQSSNLFVTLMKLGEMVKMFDTNKESSVMARTRFNGFAIFYRLLMLSIVFNEGKSVNIENLDNSERIDKKNLRKWLLNFKLLFSLNYDLILEKISQRSVIHLHGQFSTVKEGDLFYYSYALQKEDTVYYTNNILLGDYTSTKVLDNLMHQLVMKKQAFAQPIEDPLGILQKNLKLEEINEIIFFGVHPENDYHILSGIFYHFYSNQIVNPKIKYCFYREEEKEEFKTTWNHVIHNVYSSASIEYAKSILIEYCDSKEIVKESF